MTETVQTDRMPCIICFFYHRTVLRFLPRNKKSCFGIILIQYIQHFLRILRRAVIKCQIYDLFITRFRCPHCNTRLHRKLFLPLLLCFFFFLLFFFFCLFLFCLYLFYSLSFSGLLSCFSRIHSHAENCTAKCKKYKPT